jgi:hypothetical protein
METTIHKQCKGSVSSLIFQEIKKALDKKIEFIDKYINSIDESNMKDDNVKVNIFIRECRERFIEISDSTKK